MALRPNQRVLDVGWGCGATSLELARRVGLLAEYNAAINRGAAGMKLAGEGYDYSLEVDEVHGRDAIWDHVAKAASHALSNGAEVHGIDWFKENGYMVKPYSQLHWYLYPHIKKSGQIGRAHV